MARKGFGITARMIATTTLLVVGVVGGFGLLDTRQVSKLYDEVFEERVQQYDEALRIKGESTVEVFSQAVLVPLLMNSWEDVRSFMPKMKAQDPDLAIVYVLDRNRNIVAHSGRSTYSDEPTAIDDPSWPKLIERWKQKGKETRGRAEVDADVPGVGRTRFFAVPVMVGNAPPTAEAATRADPGEERLGYVVLGYSLEPIVHFTRENEAAKKAGWERTLQRTLLIGALFILLGTVLAIIQAIRIARPIRILSDRAAQLALGDLETRVEVTSSDEVGVLAENFNYMADQLYVLLSQTAEKATLEKELEVTRAVQERLLPAHSEIRVDGLSLAAFYEPASRCGGDWWTVENLANNKSLVIIGDVTGHGVPAAMVTATAKAACDVVRVSNLANLDVERLLQVMNFAILESAKREFQMTCFASIFDPATKRLEFASASHNPPLVFRSYLQGKARFKPLMGAGKRLGDAPDPTFQVAHEDLQQDDVVIWYTDGVIDCVNPLGVEYGIKRLISSIERVGASSAVAMRDAIVADALTFFERVPRRDDITLVVGKVEAI